MLSPGLVGSAAVGSACLAAAALARLRSAKPQLFHGDSPFHAAVLARCPTLTSVYRLMPFISSNGCFPAPTRTPTARKQYPLLRTDSAVFFTGVQAR